MTSVTELPTLICDREKRVLLQQFSQTFPAVECKQFVDFLVSVQKWKEVVLTSTGYLHTTSPLKEFLSAQTVEVMKLQRATPCFNMFDEAAKTVYGLITTDFVTSYQLWIEKLGGEAAALMVVKETMPVMSDPTSISNALSELGTRLPALPSSSPSSGSPSGRVRASPPVLSRTKSRSAVSVEREKSDVEAPPTASPSWMKKKGESTGGSSRETSPRPVQTLRGDYSQGHTAMEGQSDASSQEGEHHLVEPGSSKKKSSAFHSFMKLGGKQREKASSEDRTSEEDRTRKEQKVTVLDLPSHDPHGTSRKRRSSSLTTRVSISEFETLSDEPIEAGASVPNLTSATPSSITPTTSTTTLSTVTSAAENKAAQQLSAATSGALKEAHLDELLLYYIYSTPSKHILQNLMIAHGNFVSSVTLLESISKLYSSIKELESDAGLEKQLRLRAVNMVKIWIETLYKTNMAEEPYLLNKTYDLINIISNSDPELGAHVGSIMTRVTESHSQVIRYPAPQPGILPPTHLLELSSLELARQLCLIDFKLSSEVKLSEFFDAAWTVGKSPGIQKISSFTNALTYMLAGEIVSASKKEKRLKLLGKLIKLGKYLLELNNYNSLMAVYLSIHLNCVSRLKTTWKSLSRKHKLALKSLDVMNPYNNFAVYRMHIKDVRPPVILCTEVLLKDLLYQNEGAENFVDKELKLINLQKLNSMGNIMRDFFSAVLETQYSFPIQQPIYDGLLNSSPPNAEELHSKSLICEPD